METDDLNGETPIPLSKQSATELSKSAIFIPTNETEIVIPNNIDIPKLNEKRSQMRFTKDYQFNFNNLYPALHTLLLQPSEFPMNSTDQSFSIEIAKTTRGKIADRGHYNNLNQRRKIQSKIGHLDLPSYFYENSADYIPRVHSKNRISSLEKLEQMIGSKDIIIINIENILITPANTKSIFDQIQTYENLEVLSLRGTEITHVPDFVLPRLRIVDLCDNNIDNGAKLAAFVNKHKTLSILDYRRNPINEAESVRRSIIEGSVNLRYINGRQISVRDRLQALESSNDKFKRNEASKFHFFFQVKAIPEISALCKWDLRMIQHLSLPRCGLTTFCVHNFSNLVTLNLSDNNIKDLKGTGLVCCKSLISLDLRNNEINSIEQFAVFPFLDSLLHVWLSGNQIFNYREKLLNKCRNLAGTAAMSGLQSIDGVPVSISEFVSTIPECDRADELTWKLNVQRIMGDVDPSEAFSLSFSFRGLSFINVADFSSLIFLSLRGNDFEDIIGLEMCQNLTLLDISQNPKMNLDSIVPKITNLKNLQFLMMANDCWRDDLNTIDQYKDLFVENSPNRSIRNRKYREGLLKTLVPELPYLSSLDRCRITVPERCTVLLSQNRMTEDVLEIYRIHVAWLQASLPSTKIDFSPDNVIPGKQYDPSLIESMKRTFGCELKSNEILNFSIFTNLTDLDLSHNNLSTITTLGLEEHPALKYLDLSYNNIKDSPEVIGKFIDSIPKLEAISLKDNPAMKNTSDRNKILKFISRLHSMKDCFKLIDFEFDPQDIVDTRVWPDGVSKEEKQKLLPSLALKVRLPKNIEYCDVQELSLDSCSLSTINLTQFVTLKRLYLSSNQIKRTGDIVGLSKTIVLINLQNNLISKSKEVSLIIMRCPSLKNIGVSGNPFVAKDRDYRVSILASVDGILDPLYKLKAIDDKIILPSEIAKATKSHQIKAKFAFLHAIDINFQQNTTILDLSNSELTTFLDFHEFSSLKTLTLRQNKITLEAIINSNLSLCPDLESLDLSYNSITLGEGYDTLGRYLSRFKNLSKLDISFNPMCSKPKLWKSFVITYVSIADVCCPLKYINSHKLTLDERVTSVKEQLNSEIQAEGFRCRFLLFKISRDYSNLHSISLSGSSLTEISPVSELTQLQTLDLSNNCIRKLSGHGLENLKFLRTLDIHNNEIESIEDIKETLSNLPSLERLFMLNSTYSKKETSDQKKYMTEICRVLRGLQELDKYQNPIPLKANQLNALKDLEQIAGWNNPNHIHQIDLRNKNITKHDFFTVLNALESLGTVSIDLRENPCCSIPNYRFHIIYIVHCLTMVDEEQVTVNQRMNADKSVRHHVGETAAANIAIDGAMVAAEFLDNEKRDETIGGIKKAADFAYEYGSLLMKWEIFITFHQILAQIATFVEKEVWPRIYRYFTWVVFFLSIDLSFLSFLLDIRLPFWFSYASFFIYILLPAIFYGFYHMSLDKDYWFASLTTNWKHTIWLSTFAFLMTMFCSVGLSFLADFNYTIYTGKITNNQIAWFCVLALLTIIAYIIWFVCARQFRKNLKDPVLWFRVLKFKKRCSLFFLTILYFPIMKSFVSTFQCFEGHAKNFDDVSCLDVSNFKTIQVVHVAAFIFGVLYGIGIPAFFIKLIHKGVREIDLNYHIDLKYKQLDEKKKEIKKIKKSGKDVKQLEAELKITKKDIDKKYSEAAFQYENAAAYLYNAYDRKGRFKKVVSMVEKLVYLLVSSFVPSIWVKCTVNTIVMFLLTFLQIITWPFNSNSENFLETASKLCNLFTLAVAEVLQFNQKKIEIFEKYVAPSLLILFAVFIIGAFIFLVIKIHFSKFWRKKDEENANQNSQPPTTTINARDVGEIVDEGDPEMYSTMHTLNVGDGTLRRGQMIGAGSKAIKYDFSDGNNDDDELFENLKLNKRKKSKASDGQKLREEKKPRKSTSGSRKSDSKKSKNKNKSNNKDSKRADEYIMDASEDVIERSDESEIDDLNETKEDLTII